MMSGTKTRIFRRGMRAIGMREPDGEQLSETKLTMHHLGFCFREGYRCTALSIMFDYDR